MIYLNTPEAQYRLFEASGEIRDFNRDGALLSVRNPATPSNDVTLSYIEEQLTSATEASGRKIQFNYALDRLRSITLPDGSLISYDYDRDSNLTAADYGDGSVKRYHYHEQGLADPKLIHHLTGITSEDGRRYGTFNYEPNGRVIGSALESGSEQVDAVSLSYDSSTTTSVTYALGEKKIFSAGSGLYRSLENLASEAGNDKNTYLADGRLQSKTDRAEPSRSTSTSRHIYPQSSRLRVPHSNNARSSFAMSPKTHCSNTGFTTPKASYASPPFLPTMDVASKLPGHKQTLSPV